MGYPSNELRLKNLRSKMPACGVDAVIITSVPNIRYLTGFTGSSSVLVITLHTAYFLTDLRYISQAHNEVKGFRIKGYKRQVDWVSSLLMRLKAKRIGFEGKEVTHDYYRKLKSLVSGKKFISLSDNISALRSKKDEGEISLIKEAVKIGTKGFDIAKMRIKDGAVEKDVAFKMEYGMRRCGAEKTSFDIIVASGHRAALPHGRASRKKIKSGEMVIVDSGAVYEGYSSDETCTFFIGKPTRRQKEIYTIVRDAHDAAIDAVKPWVKASVIDSTARRVIKGAGYGRYFGHGTGHGIGLCVHEMPSISSFDDTLLEENMVFTIEPGIYVPDFGGVRIEDMVMVTRDGCDVLTKVSKEMTVL
ncbi:MAG: aminopeptidase P family protein [Deltaproteobacteria bacterium]|nr:aminopeptidase P family protein [Deltaproteobacteria bacterium]